MNRGIFANEYIDELVSYLKNGNQITTETRHLIYAAFLAGMKKEREIKLPKRELLLAFCDHLNEYRGMEEVRFDFMMQDFLDKSQ